MWRCGCKPDRRGTVVRTLSTHCSPPTLATTINRGKPVEHISVSEAARQIGATPRDISDLFYRRMLRDDLAPIVSGRRMIPREYLETIRDALRRAGRPVGKEVAHAS
jgi:hypothetical protein